MEEDRYSRSTTPGQSTPGAHVRHTLDHIRAIAMSCKTGKVDYDTRIRQTEIELSRMAAIKEIEFLIGQLSSLHANKLETEIELALLVAPSTLRYTAKSTIRRELHFVMHHAIHHNALIAGLPEIGPVEFPVFFGYAPSTIEAILRSNL